MYILYTISRMFLLSMTYTNTFHTKEACIKEAKLLSIEDKSNDYICVYVEENNALSAGNVRSR
jgi:hypothetical protein